MLNPPKLPICNALLQPELDFKPREDQTWKMTMDFSLVCIPMLSYSVMLSRRILNVLLHLM